MTVTTSKGKTLDINWMWGPVRTTGNVMLEVIDVRPLSEIAADLEGCETFKKMDDRKGTAVYEMYEGYTVLSSISRNKKTGGVQVTLERGDNS